MLATFNETHEPSRTYGAETDIVKPNWSKIFQTFWSHSYVVALQIQPKNLTFQIFFTSNRPFGGYFQWKPCSYSQKICNWTSDKYVKLIKINLVALLLFGFRKPSWKSKFSGFFSPLIEHLVATFIEHTHLLPESMQLNKAKRC